MFDGVADALRVPNTDIRLFGKPERFVKRRMGVALAFHADVEAARVNAKKAAGMDGEAARGIVADFLSGMPHMKFGDFRNERTTGLGHLQVSTQRTHVDMVNEAADRCQACRGCQR